MASITLDVGGGVSKKPRYVGTPQHAKDNPDRIAVFKDWLGYRWSVMRGERLLEPDPDGHENQFDTFAEAIAYADNYARSGTSE